MSTLARYGRIILRGPDKTTVQGCRDNARLCAWVVVATLPLALVAASVTHWLALPVLANGVHAVVEAVRYTRKARRLAETPQSRTPSRVLPPLPRRSK